MVAGLCSNISTESPRRWTGIKKRLGFCRLTQDGDDEGCLYLERLPKADEAVLIREAIGIRKRATISLLRDMRGPLLKRPFVAIPFVKTRRPLPPYLKARRRDGRAEVVRSVSVRKGHSSRARVGRCVCK